MKILITGGAGFIGSNFVRYMLHKYPEYDIVVLDKLTYAGNLENLKDVQKNPNFSFIKGDICDKKIDEKLIKNCDVVINFAAETHVDRSIIDAGTFVKTDVFGTYRLLEASRKFDIEKFIQISTDEVYGEALHKGGSKEDDPLVPKSPYAASKAGGDRIAYSYYTTYSLPVVISRCSNNYGQCQFPEKMVPLFITNAIRDKPLPVYGDGKNIRDWIYVLDHCSGIDKLLHLKGLEGEVFNFGSGVEKSILDIADMILEALEKPRRLIKFVEDRLGHVRRHAVNNEKAKKLLNWEPKADFNTQFEKTVEWYKENEWWWNPLVKTQ